MLQNMRVCVKVSISINYVNSYFINMSTSKFKTGEWVMSNYKFHTATIKAFLLTSTVRHLVIRSCVLLRRQSSGSCRGVSTSERLSNKKRVQLSVPSRGRQWNSSSQLQLIRRMYNFLKSDSNTGKYSSSLYFN